MDIKIVKQLPLELHDTDGADPTHLLLTKKQYKDLCNIVAPDTIELSNLIVQLKPDIT